MPSTFPERKSDWNSPTAPTQSVNRFRSSDWNGMIDHVTGYVNGNSWGITSDGATNDYAALLALVTAQGTTPTTLLLLGPTVVNTDIVIPSTMPVRFEAGGYFLGTGKVSYTPWGTGGTYYVDSVNGSDANNGNSATTALQTIAALSAKDAANPRSTWVLAAGSSWRERLIVPRNDMTIMASGSGVPPLLDASDSIAAGAWSKTGGLVSVYQATVALDVAGISSTPWVSAWEAGTRLVRASSTANCDATAGSYFPSSDSTASITLYVHAIDGTNPGANGRLYEYSSRQNGFDSRTVLRTTVTGIWTRRSLENDGSFILGKYGTATDCLATEGNKHNFYSRPGTSHLRVTARDRYYPPLDDALFVYNEGTAAGEPVTYTSCTATSTVADVHSDGFYGHVNTGGAFGTVSYTDVTATNLRRGLNIDPVTWPIVVNRGTFRNNSSAHIRSSGTSLTVTGPVTMQQTGLYNVWLPQAGTSTTIDGITTDGGESIFSNGANQTLTVRNSTLGPTDIPIFVNVTGATVVVSGNTFDIVTQQYIFVAATGALTSNNNKFVNPTSRGNFAFHLNGVYYSFAGWQALPQDAASTAIVNVPPALAPPDVVSANRGDTSQTLVAGVDAPIQRWDTALGANRTITLSATGAVNGSKFRIVRTGLGAFTLDVGGLKTIPNSTAAFVDVMYSGTAWVLTGYGTL